LGQSQSKKFKNQIMQKRKLGKSGLEVSAPGLDKIKVTGDRYPEALEKSTGL
jgi:hypothetical protein